MTSFGSPSRTMLSDGPQTSSRFFSNNESVRPSLNDTAYNGSEGHIDDRVASLELEQEDYQTTAASRAVSPRPTLGGRLLSSLSNAQPAAAALGRKGSVLHSRAKSLAAFVPKLNGSNQSTPERYERPQGPNRLFQSFFDGDSAPVRIGPPVSPTKEKEESEFVMEYRSGFTERPRSMSRRQSNAPSMMSTPASTKTSWFGRKTAAPTPTKHSMSDELATLNISNSLFPNGPADPLDPASFNDLLINATNLLNRMQTAYREKTDYIATIQPEVDAQREEVEETETRNAHLKMQLEDLGRKAHEQETAMLDMARQVQCAKEEAEEAREAAKTIRLVRESDAGVEDTPSRRCKRTSAGSAAASDSGFESDLDSVFSAGGPASPDDDGRTWEIRQPKGSSSNGSRRDLTARPGMGAGKRLGSEGAAWATVEALRGENADLKAKMAEMQATVDECIDFVGMLKS